MLSLFIEMCKLYLNLLYFRYVHAPTISASILQDISLELVQKILGFAYL